MTWSQTWDDILAGGNTRWKIDDEESKQIALNHITRVHAAVNNNNNDDEQQSSLRIFCPLAGDDLFVYHAWSQGHDVTAIDLVPAAVAQMRARFIGKDSDESAWSSESRNNGMVVWKHKSGRATLYQGDALQKLDELVGTFDAIYDKDSFGALDVSMRKEFCNRLADYTKPGSSVAYVEVKNKPEGPNQLQGPPFHLEKKDLMLESNFGRYFEHVEDFGEVYALPAAMNGMKQMGHALKRVAK